MATSVSTPQAAPPITLGRVVVLVHDYDAAVAFYRAAFGARVLFDTPRPAGGRYLHLGFGAPMGSDGCSDAPGVGIWLLQPGAEGTERVGRQTGGEPLAVFYTPDVRGAVARAEAAGASTVRPLEVADGASFAHVADLYGNVFVLVELRSDAR